MAKEFHIHNTYLKPDVFTDPVQAVQGEVDKLSGMGVNKIVVLSHSGYGVDQAVAHSAPVYLTVGGGFENRDAVPEIARRMIARLAEFESVEADSTIELEAWSVGEPLTRMLAEQRVAILERADEARRVYTRLLDVN